MNRNTKSTSRNVVARRSSKNRQNPLSTSGAARPKVNVNFDGQFLNGSQFLNTMTTILNQATGTYLLDCSANNGTGVGANAYVSAIAYGYTGITSLYNEYTYRSVRFDWVPFVSPSSADGGAQIYIGYVDNAEEIANSAAASIATGFNTSKALRNMKFFNAWERYSYSVPVSHRHRVFDVNTIASYSDVNTVDRSVQGAVLVGANGPSAAASLGQWRVTYLLELRGLNTNQIT